MSISMKKRKQQELFFRCLSSFCNLTWFNQYFTVYEFTFVGDRLLRKKSLKKILSKWNVSNQDELEKQIRWFLEVGLRQEFNQVRNQLTPLTEKARTQYIQSLDKDHPDYPKLFLTNRGLHTLTEAGIAAFDWAWSIYLCRVGRRLGYLSNNQVREWMIQAAKCSQRDYLDWNEFMTAFHLGYYFKEEDTEHNNQGKYGLSEMFNTLVDKKSPFLKIEWENDLFDE